MDRPSSTSSSESPHTRRRGARWPLAALFACALLLTGELCTRAFFKPPHVSLETYAKYYPAAPQYGFEGSRACFRVRNEMVCAPTQDMNVIPQTFPVQKPAGELRIVVVGASISWEGPAPSSSVGNYPSRMLAALQLAHPDHALRLINLSVPGSGTMREVVRFREGLEYSPDLFVIHIHDTNEIRDEQRRAYVDGIHSGLAGKLLYLDSVVVLKKTWTTVLGLPVVLGADSDTTDETAGMDEAAKVERWRIGMTHHVQTMLDLAKARSIPVILVGPSRADTSGRSGARGRPLNPFLSARVSNSVQFLDVVELFVNDFTRRRQHLYKDRIHYSAAGASLVADALSPLVENALPALRAR